MSHLDAALRGLELPGHAVVHVRVEADRDLALCGGGLHLGVGTLLPSPDLVLNRLQRTRTIAIQQASEGHSQPATYRWPGTMNNPGTDSQ